MKRSISTKKRKLQRNVRSLNRGEKMETALHKKVMLKNYLNYSGSKDRIYPIIRKYLEKAVQGKKNKHKYLIDMFCGSAVISFNSLDLFDTIVAVDKCNELIKMHTWIQNTPLEELLKQVDAVISTYELSKTNKEGFLKLREDFNKFITEEGILHPDLLFCLITHSFNYQLHLNKKGEFNVPSGAGRSYFSSSLRQKLINYKNYIHEVIKYENGDFNKSFSFAYGDAVDFVKCLKPEYFKDTVFYVDPPYSASISKHPYRIGNIKWTEDEDRKLFDCLDYIHENGGRFIFSNVLQNNGVQNIPLKTWAEKYKVNPIEVDYTFCSYQRKNNGKTDEVIITNF